MPFDLTKLTPSLLAPPELSVADLELKSETLAPFHLLVPDIHANAVTAKDIKTEDAKPLAVVPSSAYVRKAPLRSQIADEDRSPASAKVLRTVSYKGNQRNSTLEAVPGSSLRSLPSETSSLEVPPSRVPASTSDIDVASLQEVSLIQSLANRPTGEVVRLLGSIQPKLSGAALHELKRRQMSDQHIQLAIELVTGETNERLDALERLVQEQTIAPTPWLSWMAEDPDRQVRERAVRLLASVADDDARRQMRLLLHRERDESIRSLLRQLCSASGAKHGNP